MSRLEQIACEHAETGVHGRHHLAMTTVTMDALIERWPRTPEQVFGGPLMDLNAILVVADDSMPAGAWRLVDTATGTTIEQGGVDHGDDE